MFFSKESSPEIRTHHLNLTNSGSVFWKNELLFRDSLSENEELTLEYIDLKNRFAEYYLLIELVDVEWKSAFVAKVLGLAKKDINK